MLAALLELPFDVVLMVAPEVLLVLALWLLWDDRLFPPPFPLFCRLLLKLPLPLSPTEGPPLVLGLCC